VTVKFTLRQLEYLVSVGDHGSISRASDAISVSSPSISAAISQLENDLGVPLFLRKHSQGLSLTPGGRKVYEAARQLLCDANGLHDLARDITGRIRGPFNIGCFLTFAQLLLPQLRRSFERSHPEVRIRQFERDQRVLLDMLQRGDIDVALTYDLELPQDVTFRPLMWLPPLVVIAEDHPLAGAREITPEMLATEPMVLLDLPMSRDYFLSLFQKAGLRPNIAERTADMCVMRSLVGNGYGYALVNVRPCSTVSPDGKPLKYIPLQGELRSVALGLAHMRSAYSTGVLAAFEAHCVQMIGPDTAPGFGPPATVLAAE